MSAFPGHLAISASAGTGKTFQLAHRFVRLIMLGEPPERIVALTFSRKAAREIFDRVIGYLAEAGQSDEHAATRNERLGMPDLRATDYRTALRRLLDVLPRSKVGTLDSFMVGVVRAFPYELGLEPDFDVFDSQGLEAQWCRQEALRSVLLSSLTRDEEWRTFFESFKLATYGLEEKRAGQILHTLLLQYQWLYRQQPDGRRWGLDAAPGRPTFADRASWMKGIDAFRALVPGESWKSGTIAYWTEFCDNLAAWQPESEFTTRITYILERILPVRDQLGRAPIPLKFNRDTFTLSTALGTKLAALLQFMADEIIRLYAIRTKGMFRLVERCEAVYDEQIRRRGMLTFEDALLALRNHRLSVQEGEAGATDRLSIDYRLDGKLDHWLIDEFQDTSTLQWHVLANLVDEVVQDTSQRRTFFYVGDVKQAIYGWRGGNAALFEQILTRYNRAGPVIERKPLDVSFRSCQPIIDTVNLVFGNLAARVEPQVAAWWQQSWQHHSCGPTVPDNGYAGLLLIARGGSDEERSDADVRLDATADLLARIDPVGRGRTAAVLCRGNDMARRMAERVRARHPHLPVVLEGQVHITDNPAVSLLLSLLICAEHPGDRFAVCHVLMSPLADQLTEARAVFAAVQGDGFRATLARWAGILLERVNLTAFESMRIGQLLDFAALADLEPSRHIDRFVASVREFTVAESASRRAIRIMTIHKSKGLDFDVVVLPDLQGQSAGGLGPPLIQWSEDRLTPDWIMQPMRKNLVQLDDRLTGCRLAEAHREDFEDLCVLYVAMTRSARALYLVVTQTKDDSEAGHHANLLRDTLVKGDARAPALEGVDGTMAYAVGDPHWFEAFPVRDAVGNEGTEAPATATIPFALEAEERATPSRGAEFERKASLVFDPTLRARRETGTAVHALWQGITWIRTSADLVAAIPPDAPGEVRSHLERSAASPEIVALLQQPEGPAEVWREQAFEVVLHGTWISGVFDRVVIHRNAAGQVAAVDIIDFKTNHLEDQPEARQRLIEHYRPQMDTYQDVIKRLLALDAQPIRRILVFSAIGRIAFL
mgnify:CR=1 FL=1